MVKSPISRHSTTFRDDKLLADHSAQIHYITNTNTDQLVQHSSHWHAPNPHGNRLEMSKLPNWNGSDTTILMQTSSCLPFTWICPGLGLRCITFSCVCVSPSVSITLCVSPVCPSPRVLSDLPPNTWHSTHSRHFSEVKAVFETLKPSKGENTTKTKKCEVKFALPFPYSLSVRIYIQFRN